VSVDEARVRAGQPSVRNEAAVTQAAWHPPRGQRGVRSDRQVRVRGDPATAAGGQGHRGRGRGPGASHGPDGELLAGSCRCRRRTRAP
jgi:hypothetical protein